MPNKHVPNLWVRATEPEALHTAWAKVSANQGSAGGDGVGLGEFNRNLFANITELRAELLSGIYRSGPFRQVSLPKKKPGYRILTIPSIRDRVLHTSIARVLGPIFEAQFEDSSFGYRPGRGVQKAAERIEHWRKRGYDTVIEADIVKYFDSIDHDILNEKLVAALDNLPGATQITVLVQQLIDEQGKALRTPGRGIAQGSPLSPLLANLYLDALDEEIEDQGVKIVRFADDFVILCKSERKAKKVLDHCIAVLGQHNLQLHQDGTRIANFDQGFDFVGYLFLRSLALKKTAEPTLPRQKPVKSTVTDEGVIELDCEGSRFDPGHRILYVLDSNHNLTIRNRSFSVMRSGGSELIAIPHRRLGRIEVGPGVEYGASAIELAIDTGIELAIIDGLGQTKGVVLPRRPKRAGLQMDQAAAILDPVFRVEIARRLVEARIRNQRTQLKRLNRKPKIDIVEHGITAMKRHYRKLPHADKIGVLFGIEGAAAAEYWIAFGNLIDHTIGEKFVRQRPAAEPVNATINYLTGILERDTRAALHTAGLHAGFGFLHASRDRHDGLVYDLMEPFRAPLTSGLTAYLFNANRLRSEMFDSLTSDGLKIRDEGRKAIVSAYESSVAKRVNITGGTGKLAWRPMMVWQARNLAKAVTSDDPFLFRPYLMEA